MRAPASLRDRGAPAWRRGARTLVPALAALALLGAAVWGGWRVWPRRQGASAKDAPLVVNAVAKRQDLLITVDQTGSLAAKDSTQVTPEIGGRLLWVCENGLVVRKGDLVAMVDPTQTAKQVEQLTQQYEEAERKLDQAKQGREASLVGAKIKLQRAQDDAQAHERQKQASWRDTENSIAFDQAELGRRRSELEVKRRLAAEGLIAGTDVQRQEKDLDSAEFALQKRRTDFELQKSQDEASILEKQQQVQRAKEDLASQERKADRDIRMAQNSLDSLKMRLDRAREDLTKTAVLAPNGGLVVLGSSGRRGEQQPYAVGDEVSQGRAIAQVVDLLQMQVKLELDQPHIIGVKVGQQALVEVDALPRRTFKGKVTEIGKVARRPRIEGQYWRRASETTFPVTIDLPRTKEALMRPGMHANVRVVTRRVERVVTIPAGCIFQRDGQAVVYVETDGGYRPRRVKPGASNGDYTAITKGLKQGERVALNDLGAAPAESPAPAPAGLGIGAAAGASGGEPSP